MEVTISSIIRSVIAITIIFNTSICLSTSDIPEYPKSINVANFEGKPSTIIKLNCRQGNSDHEITCYKGELDIYGNNIQEKSVEQKMEKFTKEERMDFFEKNKKSMMKTCTKEFMEKLRIGAKDSPHLAPIFKQLKLFCNNPTYESLIEADKVRRQLSDQSCHVSIFSITEDFTWDNKTRKWMSQIGPDAVCGGTTTKKLYKDEKDTWIYESYGVATKKEGEYKDACTYMYDENLYQYKSKSVTASTYHHLKCNYIEF